VRVGELRGAGLGAFGVFEGLAGYLGRVDAVDGGDFETADGEVWEGWNVSWG
jgi:hypothetical protein